MTRINVIQPERPELGWFDRDAAERFHEATDWDGHNHISTNTGSQWEHEELYRTEQGRWVLHWWSQWEGSLPSYRFVDSDEAREWLLKNDEDGAVARFFGPVEAERGPTPDCWVPTNEHHAMASQQGDCSHIRDHIRLVPTGETEIGDAFGCSELERVAVRWVCPDCLRVATGEVWRAVPR